MKYALLIHNYGKRAIQYTGFNLGDPIQTLALQELYDEMGISENNIMKLNMCDLPTYDDEYVLFPTVGIGVGAGDAKLPFSPKIIPVFISTHFVVDELSESAVSYLMQYAPIGCRDEYSLHTMQKYHIPAYLSGCITATLKQREQVPNANNIYIIDAPISLNDYLPSNIKNSAVQLTHFLPIERKIMTEQEALNWLLVAQERLLLYRNTAKLVISSRMHAIVPCMAMGIPVIATFNNISYRFSWLDKFIPLYAENQFQDIQWNAQQIEYEEKKKKLIEMFKSSIELAHNKFSLIYDISNFYEDRVRAQYGNRYRTIIKNANLPNDTFEYIIWGCGLTGNNVYKFMKELYPNAKLKVAIDEYVTGCWHGVKIVRAQDIVNYENCFIILATYSGREQGFEVMNKLGKKENVDFIYLGTING